MATYSQVNAVHKTLTGTTADRVNLTAYHDGIEISNRGTVPLYVTWDGTTPTSGADGTDIVEAGVTKLFQPAIQYGGGIAGNTTTPPHLITLVGNANAYSVIGSSGQE